MPGQIFPLRGPGAGLAFGVGKRPSFLPRGDRLRQPLPAHDPSGRDTWAPFGVPFCCPGVPRLRAPPGPPRQSPAEHGFALLQVPWALRCPFVLAALGFAPPWLATPWLEPWFLPLPLGPNKGPLTRGWIYTKWSTPSCVGFP